jgi:hypothetical protein
MPIIRNQDIREYHASAGISKSGLDLFFKTDRHYYDKYLAADKEPMDSRALKIGRLAHVLLLQPELVDKEYNILPCEKQISKDDPAWLEYIKTPQFNANEWKVTDKLVKFIGTDDARETIKVGDYLDIKKMTDSLKAEPEVQLLLSDGEPEVSFYHQDKRCRADFLRNDRIIIDYKTVSGGFFSDGNKKNFRRTAEKLNYDMGAAWYSDIVSAEIGEPVDGFILLVQEKVRPYSYAIYNCPDDFIEQGRAKYEEKYARYKKCIETGIWKNSYTDGIEDLTKE